MSEREYDCEDAARAHELAEERARGVLLKAVAHLLSNLGGTLSKPVTSSADIDRLQRAWDAYHRATGQGANAGR